MNPNISFGYLFFFYSQVQFKILIFDLLIFIALELLHVTENFYFIQKKY